MWLIAMAGLPGTGKSTLAGALSRALSAPVLDKDAVRAERHGARVEYSPAQDDDVMEEVYARAGRLLAAGARHVILDGRTFTRAATVVRLREVAASLSARLLIVECRCAPELARARIAADRAAGRHRAANRSPELHAQLAAHAEPIPGARLVLCTDGSATEPLVAACLAVLGA